MRKLRGFLKFCMVCAFVLPLLLVFSACSDNDKTPPPPDENEPNEPDY